MRLKIPALLGWQTEVVEYTDSIRVLKTKFRVLGICLYKHDFRHLPNPKEKTCYKVGRFHIIKPLKIQKNE